MAARRLLPLLLVPLAAAGCRPRAELPLSRWASKTPEAEVSPAFEELVALGREAETAAPKLLVRTEFFPAHRKRAREVCAPLMARLARVQRAPVRFAYRPAGLQLVLPARRGWRLMGRAMAWDIEEAVKARAWARAIERWRLATRFGFDLTAGGASDASLGLAIADDARAALAPGLGLMDAGSLAALGAVAETTLGAKPPLAYAIRHEAENMRAILQTMQDAYASGRLTEAARPLGPSVADDVERLARGGRDKAVASFNALGEDIEGIEDELALDTKRPAPARTWKLSDGASRMRMFRRAIVGGADALLAMDDTTVARTRLLIVTARLDARAKAGQSLPKRLRDLGKGDLGRAVALDPFSGYDLAYRRDGKEWSVYSVGANGKDDGGVTGTGGLAPDLRLER